jgi:hypothetical protein
MGKRSPPCSGRESITSPQFAEGQLSHDPEIGVHDADDCRSRVVVSWRNISITLKMTRRGVLSVIALITIVGSVFGVHCKP